MHTPMRAARWTPKKGSEVTGSIRSSESRTSKAFDID
jgi:hypothetical protein